MICQTLRHLRRCTTPRLIKRYTCSSSVISPWGTSSAEPLNVQYEAAKRYLESKKLPPSVNPSAVFANTELNLDDIEVYGFDYDYTLATYKTSVEHDIHDIAKAHLLKEFKYPSEIAKIAYDPNFGIRGLHYDIDKGLFLKLDSISQIQFGAVYKGRRQLSDEEILKTYNRCRIPHDYLNFDGNKESIGNRHIFVHLVDIFSNPLASLLCGIIDFFEENNLTYTPESIYLDTREAIAMAHPEFHQDVINNPELYLEHQPDLVSYLERLRSAKKKLFLITNSPFGLVNAGMVHIMGAKEWRELFDVVIISARKPEFFNSQFNHLRECHPEKGSLSWDEVTELKPGQIYSRGNLTELKELSGWHGDNVLYFGDHPYADLADLSMNHGWRTGAIIREVEAEIKVMNKDNIKWSMNWSTILQHLIEDNQHATKECKENAFEFARWMEELESLRELLKRERNPYFGSIFRTPQNSSYFSRRLFRFADVYTSRLTNFHQYPLDHTFYPRRGALPHEFRSWFV